MVFCLASAASALAEQPENYENDARQGTGNPPAIPHKVPDSATSASCNVCHKTGLNGAMETSHPERLDCTQCHVQGEVLAPPIPHAIRGGSDGASCNRCHKTGIKGAPKTLHPERLVCSQCHERAATGAKKAPKKSLTAK
jgi:cytochrome c5